MQSLLRTKVLLFGKGYEKRHPLYKVLTETALTLNSRSTKVCKREVPFSNSNSELQNFDITVCCTVVIRVSPPEFT
jgi:hypothetical protein